MNFAKLSIIYFIILYFFCNFSLVAQPLGLKFNAIIHGEDPINPVHVTGTPDQEDQRVFFVFQDGLVKIYEKGEILDKPFLDLSKTGLNLTDFGDGSEQGMLSMGFDPDYKNNGFVYVTYSGLSTDKKSIFDWHLTAFKRSDSNPNEVDTSNYKVLLEVREPSRGHNGGQIHFGSDGYLYTTLGDGGSTANGGDNHGLIGNGQNKKTLLGKMIRLEVNGMEDYKIPPNNPFVGDTSALDEIWAYGFRNPWKFSFDKKTSDIYISDVGELTWEEVSFQLANSKGGENYGWRLKEGSSCYNPEKDCDTTTTPLTDPIFEFEHSPHEEDWRCAIIGGYVYRGDIIKPLQGYYLMADACSKDIWYVIKDSTGQWQGKLVKSEYDVAIDKYKDGLTAFGEDGQGNIYICTKRGIFILSEAVFDTSIPPDSSFKFNIFPNPASNTIKIEISNFGNELNYELTIFNNLGQIIQDYTIAQTAPYFELDVSSLKSGIYHIIIKLNNKDLVLKKKFVIY